MHKSDIGKGFNGKGQWLFGGKKKVEEEEEEGVVNGRERKKTNMLANWELSNISL